jgi:hypothetical protein
MSISQNFPEEGPTLNLNFAGSRTLDPRITFTRTSSATFMGRDGLVKIAPANSARFDHRYNSTTGEVESLGLLVEEQRTNLITNSQGTGMDDPNWGTNSNSVIIQTNSTIAPDGTLTANKVSASTVSELHLFNSNIFSATSGTTYTFSCFFKPAELSWVYFRTGGTPFGSNGFIFNITDGSLGVQVNTLDSSPIIVKYPNNWYKISITKTATSTGNGLLQIIVPNGNSTSIFSGDEISGFYVWGAQVEVGAFPTSYIPTTTSTATRTADTAFIGGSDLKTVFNEIEGSIIANISLPNDISVRGSVTTGICGLTRYSPQISGFDGYGLNIRTDTRLFSIGHRVIDESKNVNVSVNGGITESTILPNQNYKVGFFYSPDLLGLVIGNTSSVSTLSDENYGLYPKTFLYIGRSRNGGSPPYELSGHIAQLTYYPQRLQNSQLITLTK